MKTTKDIMSQMRQGLGFLLRQNYVDSGQKFYALWQLIQSTRQQLEELIDYLARTDGDDLEYTTAVCAHDYLAKAKYNMPLEQLAILMNGYDF